MQSQEREHHHDAGLVEDRYHRSNRAARQAFELWSAAHDVEMGRFASLEQVQVDQGEHTAAFQQAERDWLDASRVRAGLMLRWAALDVMRTAHMADWVHQPDVRLSTVRSERRTTPR